MGASNTPRGGPGSDLRLDRRTGGSQERRREALSGRAASVFWERAKFELRSRLDALPSTFELQTRLRGLGALAVRRDTDLVIEGFPRSGNTYAVAAFEHAQERPHAVAHHLHAPAQLHLATRWGVPALVIVRDLPDPVLSFVVRHPHLTLKQALRGYATFHESLLPVRGQIVRARFSEIIDDFGSVIVRINRQYGTTFLPYRRCDANETAVRQRVEEMEREDHGAGSLRETHVARPSKERETAKDRLRIQYEAASLRPWRERAERSYRAIVDGE